jgi:hypothetical protein
MDLDTLGITGTALLCPALEFPSLERQRRRVEQIHQFSTIAAQLTRHLSHQPIGDVTEHGIGAPGVRIGQRRTFDHPGAQMVMVRAVMIKARLQRPQARRFTELPVHHRDQVLPVPELLRVLVGLVSFYQLIKLRAGQAL